MVWRRSRQPARCPLSHRSPCPSGGPCVTSTCRRRAGEGRRAEAGRGHRDAGAGGARHLRVVGDEIPLGFAFGATLGVEGPVVEPRRPWAAPDLDAVHIHAAVLEVGAAGEHLLCLPVRVRPAPAEAGECFIEGCGFEGEVVIAGDHDFVRVWETLQELAELLDTADFSDIGEIASMYQNISIRNLLCKPLRPSVRITYAYKSNMTWNLRFTAVQECFLFTNLFNTKFLPRHRGIIVRCRHHKSSQN